ncbi:MAG: rhodanese-like domain-containing protein [Candidatus Sumerlaeota bacterium]
MTQASDCSPAELKQRLDGGEKIVLIDVREPEEVAICQIEGSLKIPMGDIPSRVTELEEFADDEVIVYCHHGVRSGHVQRFLLNHGFANVRNLVGGIDRYASDVDPAMARY